MSAESKSAFFRQSGWLVICTVACGVFLIAVYSLVQNIAQLGTFYSMLRLFTILGICTSGLQVVMAQDAAAAVTPEAKSKLAATTRSVALAILLFWAVIVVVCFAIKPWLLETLKISRPSILVVTLGLVLAQLFLPFAQGLLQGAQQFSWLGWSIVANGVGRYLAILVLLAVLTRNVTTALTGVLLGLGGAVILGLWPSRALLFSRPNAKMHWRPWLKKAVPFVAGTGSILFIMNADVLFVQAYFSREETAYYSAVAIIGIGLVSFTTPMAAVMFPKLVRSAAQSQKTDSLVLALAGTAVLGVVGALVCTALPSLPVRIINFRNPKLWDSAQLVPWFMWSMLPVTLSNVLVGNLLAKKDFRAVPWFVGIAIGYGFELNRFLEGANAEMFATFRGVIARLALFSSLLLGVAVFFTAFPARGLRVNKK